LQFPEMDTSQSGLGARYAPASLDGTRCVGCSSVEADGKVFRGLIGARTALSDGQGNIEKRQLFVNFSLRLSRACLGK
jgi:hypothetical protein